MVIHGVSLNWGIDSTIIGVNGLFQSRDHNYKVNKEEIVDTDEVAVSVVYWNPTEEATFTYVAYQPVTGFANALVQTPSLGQTVTIVDPRYPRIAGYWFCDDIVLSNSNTTAVKVTLKLTRYPYVNAFI